MTPPRAAGNTWVLAEVSRSRRAGHSPVVTAKGPGAARFPRPPGRGSGQQGTQVHVRRLCSLDAPLSATASVSIAAAQHQHDHQTPRKCTEHHPPPVPPNRPEAPLLTPASSALIRWMQIWSWFPMRPTRADDVHAGLLAAAPLSSVETTLYGLQNVFHFCQNPGFLLLSSRVCATNRCSVWHGQTCPWPPFPEMSFVLPRAF